MSSVGNYDDELDDDCWGCDSKEILISTSHPQHIRDQICPKQRVRTKWNRGCNSKLLNLH